MGLLDILNTDDGRFGLGLLAAAAPRTDGAGFGQRLNEAVGSVDQFKRQKLLAKLQELQMQEAESSMADKQAQRAQQEKIRSGMGQFFTPGQSAISSLAGDPESGILPSAGRPATAPSFDAGGAAQFLAQQGEYEKALPMLQSLQPKREKLSAGEAVYENGKKLYENPKEESKPESLKIIGAAFGEGSPEYVKALRNLATKTSTHQPGTTVSVNTGQKGFDNTLKLRGDFRSEPVYKAHQDTESAHKQISSALKMGSPASDLAAATKIMKILDPGSVVRESELAMAMKAVGLEDKIVNAIPMLLSGQKLTPTQRADFQKLADSLYEQSANQYNDKRKEYGGIAARNELNTLDVIGPEGVRPKTSGSKVIDFRSMK